MITTEEFKKLINSAHNFFEVFEGRYDAYPLALRYMGEWLENGKFEILGEDYAKVENLLANFNFNAYRNKRDQEEKNELSWKRVVEEAKEQAQSLLKIFKPGKHENIGLGLAPYLFTWNFQRFKEYIRENIKRKEDFSVVIYFSELGKVCENVQNELLQFRELKLIKNDIKEKPIRTIFNILNRELKKLGVGKNEPIAVIKIIHIYAPYYFPLADNNILKRFRLDTSATGYIDWMRKLQNWLRNYKDVIPNLEEEAKSSILKLVDELFYVMITVKLRYRVNILGL